MTAFLFFRTFQEFINYFPYEENWENNRNMTGGKSDKNVEEGK